MIRTKPGRTLGAGIFLGTHHKSETGEYLSSTVNSTSKTKEMTPQKRTRNWEMESTLR